MIANFYAHGKLLLTGEYFVLGGALALALPCKLGQTLTVQAFENPQPVLKWKSLDHGNQVWFEAEFDLESLVCLKNSDQKTAETLQQILKAAQIQNPTFLKTKKSFLAETKLEFPRLWGLGSSSTLIANIAQWSETDAFQLLDETMGGSGYDIACAAAETSILYQKMDGVPTVKKCNFKPDFHEHLYFVYLEKKQNSRDGIRHFRKKGKEQPQLIEKISRLTKAALESKNLTEFERLLAEHENLISGTLELPKVKEQYFADFPGIVKSLGAWGGDFVLVTSRLGDAKTKEYFNEKGFEVFLKYDELIL